MSRILSLDRQNKSDLRAFHKGANTKGGFNKQRIIVFTILEI